MNNFLFGVNVVTSQGHILKRQTFKRQQKLTWEAALEKVLSNSSFVRFPGIVLKRDTFEKIGYFDESVGGIADVHMWIRAFRTYGVLCVPMTTANYTVHSDALTMGMFNLPVIQSISDLFSWVESQKWIKRDILERCKVNYFHQFILAGTVRYLRRLDFKNARQTFNLFDSIDNKQQCEVKVKWRVIKVVMTVFWCLSDLLMQIPKRFKVGFVLRVL